MSKNKLSSPLREKMNMNLSTKVNSAELLSAGGNRLASPKNSNFCFDLSKKERFQYHDSEKLYKTHIKITSITPFEDASFNKTFDNKNFYNTKSNIFNGSQSKANDKNSGLGQNTAVSTRVNAENTKFRRYKRDKISNLDLDKYRSYSESKIAKLNDGVNKYIADNITIDDFYKTLLKNDIDPESKQVSRIISEIEKSGTSGNNAVGKLVKIQEISKEPDKLENKIVAKPTLQTKTSYEISNLSSLKSKNNKSFSKFKENEVQDKVSIDSKIEDNFGSGNQRKKYDKVFGKHHNESENMIAHPIGLKQIKSIKVESFNPNNTETEKNENEDYHKNKKINFFSSSQAFSVDKEPQNLEALASKKYGSIMQNYTSKDQLSFYNHKNKKNKEDTNILTNIENKVRPKKDKNITSDENLFALPKEKQKELISSPEKIKIVGLVGKAKTSMNNSEADQTKSSFDELIGWKVQKTKHDVAPTNKTINHDKSINSKKQSPFYNENKDLFVPKKREHSGLKLFGHEIPQKPIKDENSKKKRENVSLIF